jgi:hypothetical protein
MRANDTAKYNQNPKKTQKDAQHIIAIMRQIQVIHKTRYLGMRSVRWPRIVKGQGCPKTTFD